MYSIGLKMTLKPGCYDQYKAAHDHLWPEIAASMRDNGINMVVYRWSDRQLALHATAPSTEAWLRSRAHPALAGWQRVMAELLEDDGDGDVKFEPLPEVFAFGDFKAGGDADVTGVAASRPS